MNGKPLILFDLDGTLTDPKEGITKSFRYALEKMGIREADPESLTRVIGPPLWTSFQEFYGMSQEESDLAVGYYRERFGSLGLFENAVIPGIPQLLSQLKRRGRTLAVATSKPTLYSVQILEHFGLDGFFQEIVGSEMDGTRIHKEEVIAHALRLLPFPKEEAVMVGDRKHDILGARQNGIASVGVLFGYGSLEELRESGADRLAATVDELQRILLDERGAESYN